MQKMIRDEAPSPLEALRPVMECDTADLLRFLNFMSALEKWYHLKYNYEHAGPKSVEVNFREERALHVATVSMQHRLYYYDPYDPEGKPTRIDRDFIKLFPERLPPMFDGRLFTMRLLLNEFKRVKSMTLHHLHLELDRRKAEQAKAEKKNAYHTLTRDSDF
jgi:hypothetical protein